MKTQRGHGDGNHRSDCEVVINDILDTEPDYVIALKDSGKFVVNFEPGEREQSRGYRF